MNVTAATRQAPRLIFFYLKQFHPICVVHALIGCLDSLHLREMTYRNCMSTVAEKNAMSLYAEDFAAADRLEARMVAQCKLGRTRRLVKFLVGPLFLILRTAGNAPELRRAIEWHQVGLCRIKRTVFWRITVPLRGNRNFALCLVGRHPAAKCNTIG